jgi:hypothetical protein
MYCRRMAALCTAGEWQLYVLQENGRFMYCRRMAALCTAGEWQLYVCMYISTAEEGICRLKRLQLHVIYWPS